MQRVAVLAGGRARRFGGRPKGLERVGGERMLDRIVGAVSDALGVRPILITNDADAPRWRPDLRIVPDVHPGCGSLGGIFTAVTAGQGAVLVVAWDMPFVGPELLAALADGAGAHDAFLPESGGPRGVEPLCGVYGPACRAPIRAQLEQRDFRATAFHEHVNVGVLSLERVREIGEPDTMFFNVNTPDDLDRARAMVHGVRGQGRRLDAQTPSGG